MVDNRRGTRDGSAVLVWATLGVSGLFVFCTIKAGIAAILGYRSMYAALQ
jgi:hypothetical protein